MRGSRRYLPVAVGGWTPLRVAGCQVWLAADRSQLYQDVARSRLAVADGDPVGSWSDLSGNGRHVSQATAANRGVLRLAQANGRPAVQFDGVDDSLKAAPFAVSQPLTSFTVFQCQAFPAAFVSVWDGNTSDNVEAQIHTTGGHVFAPYAGGVQPDGSHELGTALHVASVVFNGAGSQAWIDGASDSAANYGANNQSGLCLGSQGGQTAAFFQGLIFEHISYAGALAMAERQAVERYLEAKYGLAVV